MCPALAAYAVYSHGKVTPCCFIHDRLRWLQEIQVALKGRDRERHTANPRTDTLSPGVGGIHKPISLNSPLACYQRTDAASIEHGTLYLGLLLHLYTQFLCPPEPLSVDHMRQEKAIRRTPGCPEQAVREEVRPALLNYLRCQYLNRKSYALLHVRCSFCQLPDAG